MNLDQLKALTREELEKLARERDIKGRSSMSHGELAKALAKSYQAVPPRI